MKLPAAATHTGQVLRHTVQGATPPIHSSANSMPSATDADTTSRLMNIGMHSSSAPMMRLTALIRATNQEGEDALTGSTRVSCGLTITTSLIATAATALAGFAAAFSDIVFPEAPAPASSVTNRITPLMPASPRTSPVARPARQPAPHHASP